MSPTLPPAPPPILRLAPDVNSQQNSENYPTGKVQSSFNPFRSLGGMSDYYRNYTESPSPYWFGRNQAAKHTNRLRSRKQAKMRAKRKAK